MACRYKLIAIDLDGTLLGPDGSVSDRNRAAIDRARKRGLHVVIATGRAVVECLDPLRQIGNTGSMIGAGGAVLSDVPTQRTVERRAIDAALVCHVSESLVRHGHKALVLKDAHVTGYDYLAVGPGALDPATVWWFKTLPVRVRHVDVPEDDPHPDDTIRVGTVALGSELADIADQLRNELEERIYLQHWAAVTDSSIPPDSRDRTHLLEVFSPRVNKWTMLQRYMAQFGIEPDDVVAIGDEINDLDMIRHAGLGVAMANAHPSVIDASDNITEPNHVHGVATAIDRVLDGRW